MSSKLIERMFNLNAATPQKAETLEMNRLRCINHRKFN